MIKRRLAFLLVPAVLLTAAPRPAQDDWLARRAQAEREFRTATQGIDASATLSVLKTIFTVPPGDGRALFDLILKNGYRRIVDVGTGRGASALWMALAARQTGGRVTTLEFNPTIAESARENFASSDVAGLIELVVGDARTKLAGVRGSFDLVFVDIGSDDARQLFDAVYPRLAPKGAIVVHDVLAKGEETEYLRFVRRQPGLNTTLLRNSDLGLAVSIKK